MAWPRRETHPRSTSSVRHPKLKKQQLQPMDEIGFCGIRKKLCIANNYTIRRLEDRMSSFWKENVDAEGGIIWMRKYDQAWSFVDSYEYRCGIIKLGEPSVVLWSRTDVTGRRRVSIVYEGILTNNDSWERYGRPPDITRPTERRNRLYTRLFSPLITNRSRNSGLTDHETISNPRKRGIPDSHNHHKTEGRNTLVNHA
ncbi:hypothetical protein K435DRAFT_806585 [Dendrothele bispora CBS 962.96]|uniref:Uncharacterized protein n=1 Tax=Dendrothele bispora (strain CBS 962.96) TaxID=1314807 RepID=A0A4S8L7T6_DENBC|nr:hypothetical protein K435DRAFT_806585 [Dendrothele bispora CBS 962.96]